MFAAFSINSMDIRMPTALRLVIAPNRPMQKSMAETPR
jgi:hypothetical protein